MGIEPDMIDVWNEGTEEIRSEIDESVGGDEGGGDGRF